MADNWDDGSDDEWDVSDDDLDKRLGLNNNNKPDTAFDDEEDLAVVEKAAAEKAQNADLKKKGNALATKKAAEEKRKEEEEIARQAVALEAEAEANMSPDELRQHQQRLIEEADNALTNDLFGADTTAATNKAAAASNSSDTVLLKDMKDHLKHARKVGEALRTHGKIHLAATFFKEALTQSKDVLDDEAVSDLIKALNVMKNEKVQASKRKVKGQAQKSKKQDKVQAAQARKIQVETFGDNDQYDDYDQIGQDYEDDFF